jgi:hypothetical protein
MEHTVNNSPSIPKNLHPIWYRHFGFQPQATRHPQPSAAKRSAQISRSAAAQPRASQAYGEWEPTCDYRPPYGSPVGIRRRLGPHTWESTVVLPGDSRYPWLDHTPEPNH